MRRRLAVPGVLALMAIGGSAPAGEQRIHRSDLPAAVASTVDAQHAERVRGLSREVKNGHPLYEAELTVDGRRRDLLIDEAGRIVEAEEEVPLASLPPAVQRGLRSAAGGGTLGPIESTTKNGRIVAYEAGVVKDGRHFEVQVDPDGRRLGPAR